MTEHDMETISPERIEHLERNGVLEIIFPKNITLHNALEKVIDALETIKERTIISERNADIIYRRLQGESLKEIGEAYRISNSRVQQIVDKSARQITAHLAGRALEPPRSAWSDGEMLLSYVLNKIPFSENVREHRRYVAKTLNELFHGGFPVRTPEGARAFLYTEKAKQKISSLRNKYFSKK